MEFTTSSVTPKLSLPTLELKNGYFVVPSHGCFNYFPIKIEESTVDSPVMRFEKAPPVLMDGVVIFGKKLYEVTSEDVMRGVIKKYREIISKRDNYGSATTTGGDRSSSEDVSSTTNQPATIQHKDKHRTVGASGLEISEVADAAWKEQIDSLLCFVSSKEGGEWEVAGVAQP